MDWAQILVIILAVTLAIFLILSIVLVIMLIRVTQQIRAVADSAQRTASGIETAVSNFSRFASPLMLFKFLKKQAGKVSKSKKED